MKQKIKSWLREWLKEEDDFTPKFSRELKACSFESKHPVGDGTYHEYLFQCTEYDNSEGYDINIHWHRKDKSSDKSISLCREEIDGVLACLNHMEYFEI
jgi:hypothetical protein